MKRNQKKSTGAGTAMVLLVFVNAIILKENLVTTTQWSWLLWITIPLLVISAVWGRLEPTKR